jgi:GDPmannose 4,6-dehydratase
MSIKKTAIITGVNGQDGSHLADFLIKKDYHVVGLKRRTSSISTDRVDHLHGNANFTLKYYDLLDPSSAYRLISECNPDEIYNLAAQSHVKVSFDIPEYTIEGIVMGTSHWLEAIRNTNRKIRFYQASSSEMYGDSICPMGGYTENSVFRPVSPYACAKLCAHHLVSVYRKSYGIHACSGILFNHEGPRRGETFVTRKITIAAAKIKLGLKKELKLGNLDAYRDWGYSGDYVKAMWMMLQHEVADDFVISTGKTHTIREFLHEVFDYANLGNYEKFVKIDPSLFRPSEVPYLLGDSSKAKSILGWHAEVDMPSLAKMMYDSDFNKVMSKKI